MVFHRKELKDFRVFDSGQVVDVMASDTLGWFEVEVQAGELWSNGIRRRGEWLRGRRRRESIK